MRVKELAGEISIGLLIWKVIDEVMGINGNVNAKDTSRRTVKVTWLSDCKRYGGKGFLFNERGSRFHGRDCYDRYFFFNGLSTFSWVHLILSQSTLSLYLFSHEISISLMLSQPSLNFRAVHGYAFFSSLPFWCLTHHTCYASILCTAYLISEPTAQGLGFALCIQYR